VSKTVSVSVDDGKRILNGSRVFIGGNDDGVSIRIFVNQNGDGLFIIADEGEILIANDRAYPAVHVRKKIE
jgi:hypothetical protein